ncbi:MAG: trehalose-phosphatase [Nevskia sp.]
MTTPQAALRSPPLLTRDQALFLDFDGTLAGIAEHPGAVSVHEGVKSWLHDLRAQLDGALAIVTGRRLHEVDAYLQPLQLVGAGAHGAEVRWLANNPIVSAMAALPQDWIAALRQSLAALPGVWLEDKVYGVAVHYRQNPAAGRDCARAVHAAIGALALDLVPGHFVVEVRHRGIGKGRAIALLLRQAVFAGRRPVFVGDDRADEDGFRTVAAAGGWGVKVGDGATAALHRIATVDGVHRWLHESTKALREQT